MKTNTNSTEYGLAPWGELTTPLLPESLRTLWRNNALPLFVCQDWGLTGPATIADLVPKALEPISAGWQASDDFEKGYLAKSLLDFDLSIRAQNGLRAAQITTVGELAVQTEDELLRLKNFGRKTLSELKGVLSSMGMSLGMNPNDSASNSNSAVESSAISTESNPPDEVERKRLTHFAANLVSARKDEIRDVRVLTCVIPPGLSFSSLPWRSRTRNCIEGAGLNSDAQKLSRMTYGEFLRIPQMGIASVLDFACVVEAAITRLADVASVIEKPEIFGRLGTLLEAPWAGKVSAQDPRFRDFVVLTRDTILDQIESISREHDGDPLLALKLAEVADDIAERVRGFSDLKLELLLKDFIERISKLSGKHLEALIARFGFSGGAPQTLEEAGAIASLTRERIRQLEKQIWDRAPRHTVFMPKLEEALDLMSESAPLNLEAAAQLLQKAELTSGPFDARSVLLAAKLCRYEPTFEVGRVRNTLCILSKKKPIHRKVISIARHQAGASGVSNVSEVLAEMVSLGFDGTERDISQLLATVPDIEFLDHEWFWNPLGIPERNRLRNSTRKMLSVASPIDVSSIREGLRRHFQYRGSRGLSLWPLVVPPRSILRSFYEAHPEFRVDENDQVHPCDDLDYRVELGPTEQVLVEVMRSSPACVLDRASYLKGCLRRGMNINTFSVFVTYSPVIAHRGLDVWSLRGVQVDPAAIEAVRAANAERPREKRAIDHGWTGEGRLWVAFRMPDRDRVESPVFGIPGAAFSFIEGREFKALDGEGTQCGTIRFSGSTSYGYGPFLKRRGADEDDILIAEFELSSGDVYLRLENDEYLDALSPST